MAKIILVTGGARSGKSAYALRLADAVAGKKLFIATCPKELDPEMTTRIRRHQEERKGSGWITVDCQVDLADVFLQHASSFDTMLLDCITLWVNNILSDATRDGFTVDDQYIRTRCNEWLDTVMPYQGLVILVTNEVGLGIVPGNALARKYRDLVGTCNQLIGARADKVALVSCGIPFYLKR